MNWLTGMTKYLWFKIVAVIPFCYLQFTQDHKNITFGIIFMVIIDTILGIWVSLEHKKFKSSNLRRIASKISGYGFAMISVWILSAVEPGLFGWVFRYTGLFFIITELLSNFEKLALIGIKIPTALIAKLNEDYKNLNGMSKKDRMKAVKKLIKS